MTRNHQRFLGRWGFTAFLLVICVLFIALQPTLAQAANTEAPIVSTDRPYQQPEIHITIPEMHSKALSASAESLKTAVSAEMLHAAAWDGNIRSPMYVDPKKVDLQHMPGSCL